MNKNVKKSIVGLVIAALLCGAISVSAFAGEAEQTQAPKVFTSANGVVSITAPFDGDNWTVVEDSDERFVIEDGRDVISVRHIANGAEEVSAPVTVNADSEVDEIIVITESTKDEIFSVMGICTVPEDKEAVRNAVLSFKVNQYGTKTAAQQQAPKEDEITIQEINEVRYCTEKDGVNVRSDYSMTNNVIGGFQYGDQVTVTGKVLKNGVDTGWIRVNYNGRDGYTNGAYYSTTKPAEKPAEQPTTAAPSQNPVRTGVTMDVYAEQGGDAITLYLMSDETWMDDYGVTYRQEGGGGEHMYGSDGSVWVFEAYFEEHEVEVGRNFTGFSQYLCNEDDRTDKILVDQLEDGRYVDQETGIIYTQEGGGGDHYYGSDGSVWVDEGYFEWLDSQNVGDAPESVDDNDYDDSDEYNGYDD